MTHHDSAAELFRSLFCEVFCRCHRPEKRATVRLRFGTSILTFEGNLFMATVADSGGPFVADISAFVDAKGNPVTDTDVPVWASSLPGVATVAANPDKPQEATITLTGLLGNTNITATFGDPVIGGFVVTGNINVIPGSAVGATMTFTGPGIVPGA